MAPTARVVLVALLLAGAGVSTGCEVAAHSTGAPDFAAVAGRVDQGLADVTATLDAGHAQAEGTGIVLSSTGEVLTNNHVIADAISITVTDAGNGRTYQAAVAGYDRRHDIAVLQLHGAAGLKTVALGGPVQPRAGQLVVALGNAGGQGGTPAMATGTVIGLDQAIRAGDPATDMFSDLTGLIASNAGIAAGYSGGPLVGADGRVVGINTARSPASRFPSVTPDEAYSIPAGQAASIARQIEAGQPTAGVHIGATAFLGLTVMLSPNPDFQYADALVTSVQPGSPAAAAGLVAGDVVTSLGPHPISSAADVADVLGLYHPGDQVSIGWASRTGQAHAATVTFGSGPAG